MRKTAKHYKKELDECRSKLESVESQVKSRLITMVEMFPDAIVLKKGTDEFKAKGVTKSWISGLSVDTMIDYIANIEEHNAKNERIVQLSMYVDHPLARG